MSMNPMSERDICKAQLGIQEKILSVQKLQLHDKNWYGKTDTHLL